MSKVGINTYQYSLDAPRVVDADPLTDAANHQGSRRVSRTATLDGGVSVFDGGYAPGDRSYRIRAKDKDGSLSAWAEDLVKYFSVVQLVTRYGVFSAVPRAWRRQGNDMCDVEFLLTGQEAG